MEDKFNAKALTYQDGLYAGENDAEDLYRYELNEVSYIGQDELELLLDIDYPMSFCKGYIKGWNKRMRYIEDHPNEFE